MDAQNKHWLVNYIQTDGLPRLMLLLFLTDIFSRDTSGQAGSPKSRSEPLRIAGVKVLPAGTPFLSPNQCQSIEGTRMQIKMLLERKVLLYCVFLKKPLSGYFARSSMCICSHSIQQTNTLLAGHNVTKVVYRLRDIVTANSSSAASGHFPVVRQYN